MYRLLLLVYWQSESIFHCCPGSDGWGGYHSVLQSCWWVMVLRNCLETIVDCLMFDDPLRSGIIEVPLGNGEVRAAVGPFGGVLIRCGRVLGGTDELAAWRLGLGTVGAALLTVVLGGFGSVMTANVFWTCVGLGFLETILVCASRQKMLDVFVRSRYIFVSMVKIALVGYLILDNYFHSFTENSSCKEGSACYSHLRQCFWVMLVFYFLEMFLAVLLLFVHHPSQGIHDLEANIFGVTLTMSSALSMTQVAIVVLLLGGSYGPLMTARGFWWCGSTLFAEMAALMGITDWVAKVVKTRIDSGMLLVTRSAFIMVPALRLLGLVIIGIPLKARTGRNFFIADMSNCDATCKARGSDLFAICWLTVAVQAGLSGSLFTRMLFPSDLPEISELGDGSLTEIKTDMRVQKGVATPLIVSGFQNNLGSMA